MLKKIKKSMLGFIVMFGIMFVGVTSLVPFYNFSLDMFIGAVIAGTMFGVLGIALVHWFE